MKTTVAEWLIAPPRQAKPAESCVLVLAGRGNSNGMMMQMARDLALDNSLIVCLRGTEYCWYPQPFSSKDQEKAVAGLPNAIKIIENAVKVIEKGFGIKREKIALFGYSAGAVMALEVAAASKTRFASVTCACGTILEPANFPDCKHPDMPVLLVHNKDDDCFDWDERYIPMKKALHRKRYNVYTLEQPFGGHLIFSHEFVAISQVVGRSLGYGEDWVHPRMRQDIEIEDDESMEESATTTETAAADSVAASATEAQETVEAK